MPLWIGKSGDLVGVMDPKLTDWQLLRGRSGALITQFHSTFSLWYWSWSRRAGHEEPFVWIMFTWTHIHESCLHEVPILHETLLHHNSWNLFAWMTLQIHDEPKVWNTFVRGKKVLHRMAVQSSTEFNNHSKQSSKIWRSQSVCHTKVYI